MSEWVNVRPAADFAPGGFEVIDVDGAAVAVFNLGGEFCAIEDVCTHDGAEIAGGCIIDGSIECPRHGARFDLRTGAVTAPPAYEPVAVFPVRVVDGMVQVRDDRWD